MARKTIAYSNSGGFWKTRYSFFSSCFGFLDKLFFSSPDKSSNGKVFWEHNKNSVPRNSFYGNQTPSSLSVTFNKQPSTNKVFKSFSIEGTSNISGLNAISVNNSSDSSQVKNANVSILEEKGGIMYGDIGSVQKVTGTNIKMIGTIDDIVETNVEGVFGINIGYFLSTNPIPASGNAKLFLIKNSDTEVFFKTEEAYTPALANSTATQIIEGQSITVNGASSLFQKNENFSSDVSFNDYLTIGDLFYNENNSFKQGNTILVSFDAENSSHAPSLGEPEVGAEDFLIHTPLPKDSPLFYSENNYVLCALTPAETSGDDPKGQYVDAAVTLGSDSFEVYALNIEYEPTQYDHSVAAKPKPQAKSSKSSKRKR